MSRFTGMYGIILVVITSLLLSGCGSDGGGGSGGGGSQGPSGPNSISLSWVAPNTNVDQTCTDDLAGFEIEYGLNSNVYFESVSLGVNEVSCAANGETTACGDVMVCSYEISNVPSGTWYVVLSAYDDAGNMSQNSNEVPFTVF